MSCDIVTKCKTVWFALVAMMKVYISQHIIDLYLYDTLAYSQLTHSYFQAKLFHAYKNIILSHLYSR